MLSISRMLAALLEYECGLELRVREMDEELETERCEEEGEKAVRRRRREVPVVLRRGVKDWKRFVRVDCILAVFVLFVGGGIGCLSSDNDDADDDDRCRSTLDRRCEFWWWWC
jgi:hypothetical protein